MNAWQSWQFIARHETRGVDYFQIPTRAEIWLEISPPPVPLSALSYDEYADLTL